MTGNPVGVIVREEDGDFADVFRLAEAAERGGLRGVTDKVYFIRMLMALLIYIRRAPSAGKCRMAPCGAGDALEWWRQQGHYRQEGPLAVARRSTVKTEPLPNWLVTAMLPPCISAMALQMARPIPVPAVLCERFRAR